MKGIRSLALVWLAAALLPAGEARAWRETGHFAVCEIAYREASAAARAAVDELLGGRDFATQCTWPDMVRKSEDWGFTYPWHYINLDPGERYFAPGNINPEGDVLQGLLLAEAKLLDPASEAAERLSALRFLAHFAGDAHQPLHVGHRLDRGGNDVEVAFFGDPDFESIAIELAPAGACDEENSGDGGAYRDEATGECVVREVSEEPTNLHKLWDLLMIQRYLADRRLRSEPGDSQFRHRAYASAVENKVPKRRLRAERGASFWEWVAESLELRRQAYDVGDGALGRRYYRRSIKVVNRRVALAGHRLAYTLDRIFAPQEVGRVERAELERIHRELRRRIVDLAGEDSPLATRLLPGGLVP